MTFSEKYRFRIIHENQFARRKERKKLRNMHRACSFRRKADKGRFQIEFFVCRYVREAAKLLFREFQCIYVYFTALVRDFKCKLYCEMKRTLKLE